MSSRSTVALALAGASSLLPFLGSALANGVCYRDAAVAEFLRLRESHVEIMVQNQVAVVTSHQEFTNDGDEPFTLTYGFPLPDGASATSLAWRIGGVWDEAPIAADPPDTLGGGGLTSDALASHLGETPLLYSCGACVVDPDSTFAVQIRYVQLLPYEFGNVVATYPNDYQAIQSTPLDVQRLTIDVSSLREIEAIDLVSHVPSSLENDGEHAVVEYDALETLADRDYQLIYTLSLDQLGLFGMSGWFDETEVPDDLGSGFFTFIAEPQPDDELVLDKVFTLMVDRSGSMQGSKIIQAREAATFIVDNLNESDLFNIVDFASDVGSLDDGHVAYTDEAATLARGYIATLEASGATNMSGAFELAIPQFATATDSTANIIIFFTDGRPTAGIREVDALLAQVQSLVLSTETDVYLFVLGIGNDVNTSLLSRLALENDGFAEFLRDSDVADEISAFYLRVRDPVLIRTDIAFQPPGMVSEVYPDPLPNLYRGSQMIVSGRYRTPGEVGVLLAGTAFGQAVIHHYELDLSETLDDRHRFMTKLWAKTKIEHLLMRYYASADLAEQEALEEEIVALSIAYGVVSPFTSFDGGETPIDEEDDEGTPPIAIDGPYRLLGSHPNPFNPRTTISFAVATDLHGPVFVRIYDVRGRLVTQLTVTVTGPGAYHVVWDGTYADGTRASSGAYLYTIDLGDGLLVGKMLMVE